MMSRLFVKRGAAKNWMSLFDESVADLEKACTFKLLFSEIEINELKGDIERIK